MRAVDIQGERFDNLTVIKFSHYGRGGKDKYWKLLCDCGEFCYATQSCLKRGRRNFCKKCNNKKSNNSGINILYKSYKRNANNRNYIFELSFIDFENLIFKNCYYCGFKPSNKSKKTMKYKFNYNGIDRVDNKIGYTLKNCVTCCKYCNNAKKDNDVDEFKEWLEYVKTINCN